VRVSSTVERLDVAPGGTGVVPLEVVNTSNVIDSLSVHALGVPDAVVRAEPAALALFPDAAGALTLTVALPEAFPAGTYPMTLVVAGAADGARQAYHDVDLVVPPHPRLRVESTPTIARTRGRGAFTVEVRNEGNVPLDVALRAVDTDRQLRTTLTPSTLSVPPGGVGTCTVLAKGPRQLLGSDRDRPFTVVAQAPETSAQVPLVLRQRSTISRGLLTALILLGILVAWALAFLLGMKQVLGTDPYTKVAPASFFAAAPAAADGSGKPDRVGSAGGSTTGAAPDAAAAPAGSLPKDGPLPAGVGGTIAGTVTGKDDHQGVGRLTVVALRQGREGLVEVSSAATQADGTYAIAGLFPGAYYLRVAEDGYATAWYPDAASQADSTRVTASAAKVTPGIDLVVEGASASISGHVDVGDATSAVVVHVTAKPAWSGADPTVHYDVDADPAGDYSFADLPAPGTYELTFAADGYQSSTTTERVLGGQQRFALGVRLGAGVGQIAGIVTDGTKALGGVTVSTTVAGKPVVVGSPTLGQVGAFVVPNLPTPATYVLTFAKEGFGSKTVVVDLAAGQSRTDLQVSLAGGTGTVHGTVLDAQGHGLGGVTVTVGGGSTSLTTTTLTAGAVGTFTLTGLPAPGSVTLTFTRPGYAAVSVPVTLTDSGAPPAVKVTLPSALGTVTGRVAGNGVGLVGMTVQATDGTTTRSTTTTASGAYGKGTYVLGDLPSGTWTLTVTDEGSVVATAVVTVSAGATVVQDLPVGD
jgi:hypothetical protein